MKLENGGITTTATNPSDIASLKRRGWKEVLEEVKAEVQPVEAVPAPARAPKLEKAPKPKLENKKAVNDV